MLLTKNKFKKFGLGSKQIQKFKKSNFTSIESFKFNGIDIQISNPFWFLHSVEEIFLDDIYEFRANTDEPLIIDCGANWGLSIIYFKEIYPKSKIIAFEPDPHIFKQLSYNIKNSNFSDVTLINKAVWNKTEKLFFSSDNALGGTLSQIEINTENQIEVSAIRFRDIIVENSKIDFLKIDIEGAEYEVLKDCHEVLGNVKNLFVEYHSSPQNQQHLHEILLFIQEAGFRYYIKEAWNNMTKPFIAKKNLYYDLQLNIFCYRK